MAFQSIGNIVTRSRKRTVHRCRVALPTPSIRLMGQSQAQRSGLTVNNGQLLHRHFGWNRYRSGKSNIFENRPHLLHLLPVRQAKHEADLPDICRQGSRSGNRTNECSNGSGRVPGLPVYLQSRDMAHGERRRNFAEWKHDGRWRRHWLRLLRTGIETLIVDMNDYTNLPERLQHDESNECAPANFCALTGTAPSTTAPASSTPTIHCSTTVDSVCSKWANKDVKCPNGKCFGFSINTVR